MDFPQYRKLNNDQVYYRINSERDFNELKVVGNTVQHFHITASQYPEILRIQEMLSFKVEHIITCEASEYEEIAQRITHYQ